MNLNDSRLALLSLLGITIPPLVFGIFLGRAPLWFRLSCLLPLAGVLYGAGLYYVYEAFFMVGDLEDIVSMGLLGGALGYFPILVLGPVAWRARARVRLSLDSLMLGIALFAFSLFLMRFLANRLLPGS